MGDISISDYLEWSFQVLTCIKQAIEDREELKQELADLEALIKVVQADLRVAKELRETEDRLNSVFDPSQRDEFGLPLDGRPAYIKAGQLLKERLKRAQKVIQSLSSTSRKIFKSKARRDVQAVTAEIFQSVELLRVGIDNKRRAMNITENASETKEAMLLQGQLDSVKRQIEVENNPETRELLQSEALINHLMELVQILQEMDKVAFPVFPSVLKSYASDLSLYDRRCIALSKHPLHRIKMTVCNAIRVDGDQIKQDDQLLTELKSQTRFRDDVERVALDLLIESEGALKKGESKITKAMTSLKPIMERFKAMTMFPETEIFISIIRRNFQDVEKLMIVAYSLEKFYESSLTSEEQVESGKELSTLRKQLSRRRGMDFSKEFVDHVMASKGKIMTILKTCISKLEAQIEAKAEENPQLETLTTNLQLIQEDVTQLQQMIGELKARG